MGYPKTTSIKYSLPGYLGQVPVVKLITENGCPYCKVVRKNVLDPLDRFSVINLTEYDFYLHVDEFVNQARWYHQKTGSFKPPKIKVEWKKTRHNKKESIFIWVKEETLKEFKKRLYQYLKQGGLRIPNRIIEEIPPEWKEKKFTK